MSVAVLWPVSALRGSILKHIDLFRVAFIDLQPRGDLIMSHRRSLSVFAVAILVLLPVSSVFAADEPSPNALWIGIPGLTQSEIGDLVDRVDLRGTYGDLTLGVGDTAALAALLRSHPRAFAVAEVRPSETVYVVYLGPGETVADRPPARLLARRGHQAIIAVPDDGSLSVLDLLGPDRLPFFHGGVARVPDRRQRPQRDRPAQLADLPLLDASVQGWVDSVSQTNLESDVTFLSTNFTTRKSDSGGGRDAQDWLQSRFEEMGLQTSLHNFDSNADNVVGEIPGALEPERVVIVGAHYDSLSFQGSTAPGADDNASGTAALLEIARILTSEGAAFRYTLRFIAFASEEFGLIGSDAYSARMVAQGVDVVAMLNTDMNAYRRAGDALDLDMVTNNTTPWLNDLVQEISHLYVPTLPTREGGLSGGSSDHQPFFTDGFPAVFYFEDSSDYSPFIHTSNDVVGTSANDFELSRRIVQSVLAGAAVLADPVEPNPAPVLVVSGICPGTLSLEVTGATPNSPLLFLGSSAEGEFVVPRGLCVGTRLGLAGPDLLTTVNTGFDGSFSIAIEVPVPACGTYLQVLDRVACRETNVDRLP